MSGNYFCRLSSRTFVWIRRASFVSAFAFSASHAFAAAPAIVADAQQTLGSGYHNPRAVAAAPNGTVYVADSANNQVMQLIPNLPGSSMQTQVKTTGYQLVNPEAVAVDAQGDLYIGDAPKAGVTGRVIEVLANSGGVLTATVKQIYAGSTVLEPVSMVVDSSNTLYIGDKKQCDAGAVFSLPAGSTTPHAINFTGLPSAFVPAALARDAANNLYLANSDAQGGGIYKAPAAGGAAQPVATGSFGLNAPVGLALDASGDLFILAQLGAGQCNNSGPQVIEIPAASASTPYILPTTNLQTSSGIALDPSGNLDIAEVGNGGTGSGLVAQLNFANPVDLGSVNVFATGPAVVFNFAFNTPATFSGFRAMTVGDMGSNRNDVVAGSVGTCKAQTLSGNTAYAPYLCEQTFAATPAYTGTRMSAIQVKGSGSTILDSSPVYETGLSAAQITYPLDMSTTALGLVQPQGVASSGFDQTVYVADLGNGKVYSIGGLSGSALKVVSTGTIALQAPSAVAMNGEGDLFIADFNLGEIVVVPTTTGKAPFVLNTGGLLQHPISLTLDFMGDLYVGDAGAAGDDASSGAPGFVVEVPYKGSAFVLPTPGVAVIFPQALAVDSVSGNLFIGDGGDVSTGIGQTVKVPASGGKASVVAITGVSVPTDPTGLALDAAENLYVLDGLVGTITVVPANGSSHLLSFSGRAALSAPSALVNSAGSQSLVIANIGNGNNNSLVYLNGNSSTMAFGSEMLHIGSASQTATVANIGNQDLVFASKFDSIAGTDSALSLLGSSLCTGGATLAPSASCSLNMQFNPATVGTHSEQITFNSNAYNDGVPVVNLSGTGVTGSQGNVKITLRSPLTAKTRRKSFKAAHRD